MIDIISTDSAVKCFLPCLRKASQKKLCFLKEITRTFHLHQLFTSVPCSYIVILFKENNVLGQGEQIVRDEYLSDEKWNFFGQAACRILVH